MDIDIGTCETSFNCGLSIAAHVAPPSVVRSGTSPPRVTVMCVEFRISKSLKEPTRPLWCGVAGVGDGPLGVATLT